jgi:hypothetical protein
MRRLLLLLFAGCAAPPEATTPAPAPLKQPPPAIPFLIETLRSDDIEERDRAEADLLALGEAAETALRDAARSTDSLEVRSRLEVVLEKLEIRPTLPAEGRLGDVRIAAMHAFAWQNPPRGETIYVSTVWSLRNEGDRESTLRISRARVVHKGRSRDVALCGTKGAEEPDPVYVLAAGGVKKPALKMLECPPAPPGDEVYAVLEFTDGSGRTLRLRSGDAGVEKVE